MFFTSSRPLPKSEIPPQVVQTPGNPYWEWKLVELPGASLEVRFRLMCPDPRPEENRDHWLGEANLPPPRGCPRCLTAQAELRLNRTTANDYVPRLEIIRCACDEGLWRCPVHAPPNMYLPEATASDPRVASMLMSDEEFCKHLVALAQRLTG